MKLEKGVIFLDNNNKDIYYIKEKEDDFIYFVTWRRNPSRIETGWSELKEWKKFFSYTSKNNPGRIIPFNESKTTLKRKRKMLSQIFKLP